ncbi:MAG TPA: TonB-dependent receptor [Polyangiales bacterium]|nr:TonB-dependent receptor [Polyangiales bacterium]
MVLSCWICGVVAAQAQDAGVPEGQRPPARVPDFVPEDEGREPRQPAPPPDPHVKVDPKSWLPPPVAAPAPEYSARATATRTSAAATLPVSVSVLDRADVDLHPAHTSDAVLRSLPSAATFRRSSSMVADPSAQGLNLRGLAPSGVSRTLVLRDGVPENDPFGGWVYWRALPHLDIDRIEVVPGGGSALYGSAALGGVVQVFSRPPSQIGLDADFSYGNLDTWELGGRVANEFGPFGVALSGDWLKSDGYQIVAPDQRGAIDGETPSESGNFNGRFSLSLPGLRLWAAMGWFREVQNGGTEYTSAEVTLGRASAGLTWRPGDASQLDLLLYGRRACFEQVRARVSEDRSSEERASQQHVPAGDEGGSLAWTAPEIHGFGRHQLLIGLDARHVSGESTDQLFPAQPMADSVLEKRSGGQQWLLGGFVQDVVQATRELSVQANLRTDVWHNFDGARELERMDGSSRTFDSQARTSVSVNPRLGVVHQTLPWLQLRAAGYRAFRAPTLNELYRSFQVGTILTAANDQLGPEHVLGAEIGANFEPATGIRLRLTGFLNFLQDPISNVTLASALPDGSTRQRQNLGSARVGGLEVDARWLLGPHLRVTFGYTWAHSEVTDAGDMPALVGKQLAQDPEHRATLAGILDLRQFFTTSIQLRVIGPQYEDDLNTLSMHGYVLLDAFLSRTFVGGWEVFAAGENLLSTDYLVGRAGVDTVGAPLTFRFGLRIRAPRFL